MSWWPTLLSILGSIFKRRVVSAVREQSKPTSLVPSEELGKQNREQIAEQIEKGITRIEQVHISAVRERLEPSAPQPGIILGSGLIPLNLLIIILILAIIFFPSNVLRIILGIPFLLFLPGYALLAALFPKKEGLGSIERVALSFGLSIAVAPLTGLIINYTAWGIKLESTLYSLALFTLITSIVAWLRQRRLTEHERFAIKLRVTMPGWGKGGWDRVLAIILVIAILGSLGTLGYIIATPKVEETFTEFYILGQEGKTADYPRELKIGEEGRVIVAITNDEGKEVSYRLVVVIGNKKSTEVGPLVLVDEQKWEGEISFVLETAGENQKVEFLLYRDGEVEPCLGPLYLWVDVSQ